VLATIVNRIELSPMHRSRPVVPDRGKRSGGAMTGGEDLAIALAGLERASFRLTSVGGNVKARAFASG
jgi:hypothetical protein